MEVELDSALLRANGRNDLTLLGLCAFGLTERHRVIPDDTAVWNEWAAGFGPSVEEEVATAWQESERSAATGRQATRLRVSPAQRCLQMSRLQLPPEDAFNLLARPLRVLLENGRNDRAFLLSFANQSMRKRLTDAELRGWIVFETAGGIGEIKVRLENAEHVPDLQHLRTVYLCDSDARVAGHPTLEAQAVNKGLRQLVARFGAPPDAFGKVLTRRAVENYAPPGDVLAWAKAGVKSAHEVFSQADTEAGRKTLAQGPGNPGTPRRRLLAAIALKQIASSTVDVPDFLDMKRGMSGTDTALWARLDAFQTAVLKDGFGDSFSADFYGAHAGLKDASGEVANFLITLSEQL